MPRCYSVTDIARALDEHSPAILQFIGHGSSKGLCFENVVGRAQMVDKMPLAKLLHNQKGLKLVILNACYSHDQAQSLADSVGHVIGREGPIQDIDAINFSTDFFTALRHGRTFEESFGRAKAAVQLQTTALSPHFLKARSEKEIAHQSQDQISQSNLPGDDGYP
ncbi:hypothetical protein K469DRAFT_685989 [Zopfia rhizophila CBS 207.26]|uniref:CHAT domain-containing protein n=1 Tax=Zopfia rhizophila CBS 207.26 TaxID=1314779 RepID=A0A6A6E6G2_9PEZI|nr:hypothetical protein K469DRAFT_685989 [Zopfia rhizophila CBS 207.26]